jgi:outer membrane protein
LSGAQVLSAPEHAMTIRPMTLLRIEAAGLAVAIAVSGAARAETLPDAIAMAYQSNPTLLAQRATLRATDET